jgi:Skp family chaperone for outer membrane proteins
MIAGLMLGGASQVALAQDIPGPVAQGVAVANLDAVVANSNAFKTAQQQRQVTYKAQIDQAEARRKQISAQLQPLVNKYNTDARAANPNQASLEQQAATIQQIQESGKEELQRILQPVALSEAYVNEQIGDKLPTAVTNAMTKQKVTLLLSPDAVLHANNAYNLNQAVLNELNTLEPSAQLVPPAGWQPREVREAQQQQQQQAQPAPQAGPQPRGR